MNPETVKFGTIHKPLPNMIVISGKVIPGNPKKRAIWDPALDYVKEAVEQTRLDLIDYFTEK
jgi:hypothetical protein